MLGPEYGRDCLNYLRNNNVLLDHMIPFQPVDKLVGECSILSAKEKAGKWENSQPCQIHCLLPDLLLGIMYGRSPIAR